jgi:dephospho-CoA kinase
MRRIILGITGGTSSGKNTVAEHLKERHGFISYGLSDYLTKVAHGYRIRPNRITLKLIGDSLRDQFGDDVLAREALLWVQQQTRARRFVIEGIRHPEESILLQENGASIIGIHISPRTAFERMMRRDREGDPKNLKDFQELHQTYVTGNPLLKKCLDIADYSIVNDDTLDSLRRKVDSVVEKEIAKRPQGKER